MSRPITNPHRFDASCRAAAADRRTTTARQIAVLVISFVIFLLWAAPIRAASPQPPQTFSDGETAGWTAGRAGVTPIVDSIGDEFFLQIESSGFGPGSRLAAFNDDADWTGDYLAADIDSFMLDMMNPVSSPELEMRLVLFGPENTSNRWTSTEAAIVPNDGQWRSYSFGISESELTRVRGESTFDAMIQDVQRVMLRHDAGTPSSGGTMIEATIRVDNLALLAGMSLDCSGDGEVTFDDLTCSNAAGTTSDLLDELRLLPGDLDGQGGVAFSDFVILAGNFGTDSNIYTDGDINGEGGVGFGDFVILASNFGESVTEVAAVPEPTAWMLAGFPIAWLLHRRRRKAF